MTESKNVSTKSGRMYTSYNEEIPGQLSYQNIKLANFIELELTDLYDSLQQIQPHNYQNYVKDCLSRSYNAFHEMKKLYIDLGMSFLYTQTKKLISGYGILFVFLQEKLEEKDQEMREKDQQIQMLKNKKVRAHGGFRTQIELEVRNSIENATSKKQDKQTKIFKKLKGVHLFNESYARHIDYNIEEFRKMREDDKKRKQQQQNVLTKEQEQAKLKKMIQDQYNDQSHLTVDGEELYVFLNRQKYVNQQIRNISLGDELQQIASYFKQSQNQALEFLRKSKSQESFHQLTQGFNIVVQEYQKSKATQMESIKDKLYQVLQQIKLKSLSIQAALVLKQKQIEEIKEKIVSDIKQTADNSSQTIYNYEEDIKNLYRKIVELQMVNQEMKNYVQKCLEEDKKEKDALYGQIGTKQGQLKQIKDSLEQRNQYVSKIERKVRIMADNNRTKEIVDPIAFFNEMDDFMKKVFVEELREQGFFTSKKTDKQSKLIYKNGGRTDEGRNKQASYQPYADKPELSWSGQKQLLKSGMKLKKRQSFALKRGSQMRKQVSPKNSFIKTQSGVQQSHFKNQTYDGEENLTSKNQLYKASNNNLTFPKSNVNRDNLTKKVPSKKIITLPKGPYEPKHAQQKIRVFDVSSNIGVNYSQTHIDYTSSKKIILKPQQGSERQIVVKKNANKKKVTEMDQEQSQFQKQIQHRNEDNGLIKASKYRLESKENRKSKTKKKNNSKMIEIQENTQIYEESGQSYIVQNQKQEQNQKQNKGKKWDQSKKFQQQQEKFDGQQSESSMEYTQQLIEDGKKRQEGKKGKKGTKEKKEKEYVTKYEEKNQIKVKGRVQSEALTSNDEFQTDSQEQIIIKKKRDERKQKDSVICHQFNMFIFSNNNTAEKTPIQAQPKGNDRISFYQQKLEGAHLRTNQQENGTVKKILEQKKVNQKQITQKNFLTKSKSKQNLMNSTSKTTMKGFKSIKKNNKKDDQKTKEQNMRNQKEKTMYNGIWKNSKHSNMRKSMDKEEDKICGWEQGKIDEQKNRNILKEISIVNKTNQKVSKTSSRHQYIGKNDSQNPARQLLQMNFEQVEVIQAAEKAKNVEQFKQSVIKLHKSKCGANCKHLQRYMNIYNKFKKISSFNRRQLIKIHVENLNANFEEEQECVASPKNVGLPAIKK